MLGVRHVCNCKPDETVARGFGQLRRRAEHHLPCQPHVEQPRSRHRSRREVGRELLQPRHRQLVAEDEEPRTAARFAFAPVAQGLHNVVRKHVAAQPARHLLYGYLMARKEGDEGSPDGRHRRACVHRKIDAECVAGEHQLTLKGALRMADAEDAGCMVLVRFGIGGVGGMHRASKRVMFPCRHLRAVVAGPMNDFCRAPRALRNKASAPSVLCATPRSASTCATSGRGAPHFCPTDRNPFLSALPSLQWRPYCATSLLPDEPDHGLLPTSVRCGCVPGSHECSPRKDGSLPARRRIIASSRRPGGP